MKRIFLVRHATAQDRAEGLPDFERSLVKKGEKEAKAVARHLAETYAIPDLMISSFANRAIETAYLFAKAFGYPSQKILLRDTFYGNPATDALAAEIGRQPDKYSSLMLIGHDPAFSQLAAYLVKGLRETIPKAGVVAADLAIDHWADMKSGSGKLLEFTSPARLKEKKKQVRTGLEARLVRSMDGILSRANRPAAAALKDEIRKSARKLVKEFIKNQQEGRQGRPGNRKPRAAR
ncbi:MAG: histidine phosphatase family protein [Candidatus Aminicenantales bacterium]|jgi:phosphohistidine phosphatase